MLQKLRERSSSEAGFTLVELLVVMLILGLLAAIAIPSFFNQRDKAKDADGKEAVRTAQTAMETYATDNDGSYSGADAGALQNIEQTLNDLPGVLTATPTADGKGYTVDVTVTDTGNHFSISRDGDTGVVSYTCEDGGNAGCPEGGDWGG